MSRRKSRTPVRTVNPKPAGVDVPRVLRRVFVAVAILGFASAGLAAYKHNHDVLHDLSVVGGGVPVVVQIHDPGCSQCLRLKRNVEAALRGFDESLHYRIASIGTREGRALANRHGVPHVTLLFFDGAGRVQRTTNGVIDPEALERLFRLHAAAPQSSSSP